MLLGRARWLGAGGALLLASFAALALGAGAARAVQTSPLVGEVWASEVAATSARLSGEVVPNGSATSYDFDYLAESAYEANLAAGREGFTGAATAPSGGKAVSGSSPALVSQPLVSLAPGTAYRYRLRAESAGAAASSPPLGFTTQPSPPIACEGDACQPLPSEPAEQVITTLIPGPGNPAVSYLKIRHRRHARKRAHHHRRHRAPGQGKSRRRR